MSLEIPPKLPGRQNGTTIPSEAFSDMTVNVNYLGDHCDRTSVKILEPRVMWRTLVPVALPPPDKNIPRKAVM